MPIKDTIPFVDSTDDLPQSVDPHLEQHGISITMPNRHQNHGHNASIAHLLSNNEMSLIVGDINAHHSRYDTNTKERGEQLADEIDAADYTVLSENETTQLATSGWSTSPDIS